MKIHPDFITEDDEEDLRCRIEVALEKIPQRKGQLRNRILRFGWDYENPKKWLRDIPFFMAEWEWDAGRQKSFSAADYDSVTINEYLRGQRIAPHIDSPAFGDVAILSLLADVTMRFTSPAGETRDFLLPRRSLAVMSGELRSRWEHSTLPIESEKRLSIIYRNRVA